jgi:DNA (cytosine-5)-methyltransferase 1
MRSIELFAGAGGLAIAGSWAGLHHEAVLEWNRHACETMRFNQGRGVPYVEGAEIIEGDVRVVDFRRFRGIDIITGGPPCQPFSIGGKHGGHLDERDMFPQAVRAA